MKNLRHLYLTVFLTFGVSCGQTSTSQKTRNIKEKNEKIETKNTEESTEIKMTKSNYDSERSEKIKFAIDEDIQQAGFLGDIGDFVQDTIDVVKDNPIAAATVFVDPTGLTAASIVATKEVVQVAAGIVGSAGTCSWKDYWDGHKGMRDLYNAHWVSKGISPTDALRKSASLIHYGNSGKNEGRCNPIGSSSASSIVRSIFSSSGSSNSTGTCSWGEYWDKHDGIRNLYKSHWAEIGHNPTESDKKNVVTSHYNNYGKNEGMCKPY